MNTSRYCLDTSTGQVDLCWNLVQLFVVTTFLLARPSSGALSGAVTEGVGSDPPVQLAADSVRWDAATSVDERLASLDVTARGPLAAGPSGTPPLAWMASGCEAAPVPVVVQFACPDTASHRDCRDVVVALMTAAPRCNLQY